MTNPETRRQKQLARKRQKRKEKTAKASVGELWSIAKEITLAAHAPIHDCLVPADLFEQGIGNLVFSRSLPDGRIVIGMFLVDVFCLGVKNAFYAIVARDDYARRLSRLPGIESFRPVHPAYFRKLVEGAVAYALELGLKPHPEYALARLIFGDVEAADCPEHFEYGQEGKPYYVSGPNETATQARTIVDQLQRRLGPGMFHYTVFVQ